MPEYNKLVRDKIPDIITADGMIPVSRTLSDGEYEMALIAKISEEQRELALADTTQQMLEELADLKEVVLALARHISSEADLETVRAQKAEARGGFEQRIFLERTETPE